MKSIIFASFLFCLALNVRAQQQQQIDSATPGQWVRLNSGTTQSLLSVSYPSNDSIWAGGLFRSTDGGATWHSVPHPGGEAGGSFQSGLEGISGLFGGPYTFVTHDGALTWDTVNTGGVNPINKICWASPDTCFVVGGGISRSTDGGLTWTMTPGSAYNELWNTFGGVSFCNTKVGYATGPEIYGLFPHQNDLAGECFKTTDGGGHWNALWTGIPIDLKLAAAINPDTIIAVTSSDIPLIIYRSTDGGASWLQPSSPAENEEPEGIAMIGNTGFIVGTGGLILHTSDAGFTWEQEGSGITSESLYSVSMLDDTDAIAVGTNGIIIKRTNGSAGVLTPPNDTLSVQVFPDPSQNTITLSYALVEPQNVTLTISNVNGNIVATPLQGVFQNQGLQSVPLSTANLASGVYYYQLSSANYSANGSFTVIQ